MPWLLKQIKTKEYFRRYAKQYRNIILAGINYSAETGEHQCLVERHAAEQAGPEAGNKCDPMI